MDYGHKLMYVFISIQIENLFFYTKHMYVFIELIYIKNIVFIKFICKFNWALEVKWVLRNDLSLEKTRKCSNANSVYRINSKLWFWPLDFKIWYQQTANNINRKCQNNVTTVNRLTLCWQWRIHLRARGYNCTPKLEY